jgi:hypothetical protein
MLLVNYSYATFIHYKNPKPDEFRHKKPRRHLVTYYKHMIYYELDSW